MLLRRVIQHVQDQNWTAICIDFVIVVFGVFIGIQVSNWNDERAAQAHELRLLHELRAEIEMNADSARMTGEGLTVGAEAARRILTLAATQEDPCGGDCWPAVVDLMHASQWQRTLDAWPTYDELRRSGLPSERSVIDAVERYQSISDRSGTGIEVPPDYRSLVRRLIPIALQDRYWEACFIETGGSETYRYPCPGSPSADPVDPALVVEILGNTEVMQALREWTSIARTTGRALETDQQAAADAALAAIDRILAGD